MGSKRKSIHINFSVSTSTQNSSSLFFLPSTQACAHNINTASINICPSATRCGQAAGK